MFSIKSRNLIWITALATLSMLASCETNSNSSNLANTTLSEFPQLRSTSKAELVDQARRALDGNLLKSATASDFTALGRYFAENREWLKREAKHRFGNGVEISELVDGAQARLRLNGLEHAIKIEALNADRIVLARADQQDYGVMLDPDIFYYDQQDIPVFLSRLGSELEITTIRLPKVENLSTDDGFVQAVNALSFPVYVLTLAQYEMDPENEKSARARIAQLIQETKKKKRAMQGLPPCEDCGGGGGEEPPVTVPYLVVKEVILKKKMDDTNEEFELYYSEEPGNINGTTIHLFYGRDWADAAGRTVYYPDVNDKQTYTCPSDIAIYPLTGVTVRFAGLEDDDDAGKHDKYNDPDNVRIRNMQVYRTTTNSIVYMDWTWNCPGKTYESDDPYDKSGVDKISEQAMIDRQANVGYIVTGSATTGLEHVNWKYGMRSY